MNHPLNKYLAQAGVTSRRKAVDLIKSGAVTVNNHVVKEPYHQVSSDDTIKVNGALIHQIIVKHVFILNKPKGYITTTSDDRKRRTVMDLFVDIKERLFPIGRLDKDTTGVLLITNDGDLAHKLSHPRYEVAKVYDVVLDRPFEHRDYELIKRGLRLSDGIIKVDHIVYRKHSKKVRLSLHSGKNRIVRRIFEHIGYEVKALDRKAYAGLTHFGLARGAWRSLTKQEHSKLTAR
ncbi:rRNA pseudouridine synthase [Candidatus Babeliales bacterium]|nr:rRNA pseudouridine synthase [Candidatus Babeliales bacterium]